MALRSPSSSSFSYGFTYDVFLSFSGTDTRYCFTGTLYKVLCDRGIRAFIDDEELKGGDEITPSLVEAIKESRIAIPVFSENYASSSFCLDELVTIIECVKAEGRLLLPVFYRVDPSHVRHQTKSYGKALARHEERFQNNKEKYADNMERLRKWKMALTQAANLSGKHFILGKEYEHKFVGKIVTEVSNKINRAPLHVADYPVGLESRVLEVKLLLDVGLGSDDGVHMVGIYGVGGMGKTTLARAIYNSIADQFEGLCFLDDVRKNSNKHGLVYLQETLLFETIGEKDIRLGSLNKGIPIIKQRLHRKKVLLILDDVDKLEQLRALAGRCDWFGPGSRVIITTRGKQLPASHGIERTYEVDGLEREEALELLTWNAFQKNRVDSSYEDILNRVIAYASGLPLALEVVGSNLYGKPIEEWESVLDMYRRIPNNDIQNILKVSFDSLQEEEQSVFLDISCCFKGYRLLEVKDILHAHYAYCVKHHIGVLAEKSLIKISQGDYVTLHDLIESMGKEIVRQESPKEPGKRSRLWFHKDVVQVLEDNTGTSRIEVIHLDSPSFEELVEWEGDGFKNMKNLKTIIIKSGRFSNGVGHFPNSLRVLEWNGYPSQSLPYDFFPKKLSICKLGGSYLTSFELPYSLKELHKSGGTAFCLPGTATIPEWFEHQNKGLSISFWFRNKFPSMTLFVIREHMLPLYYEFPSIEPDLFINGHHQKYVPDGFGVDFFSTAGIEPNHIYLFDLQLHNHCYEFDLQLHCHEGDKSKLEEAQLKNKWNHAELRYDVKGSGFHALSDEVSYLEIGIHAFEQRNSMEDIQFTNPYGKRKLHGKGFKLRPRFRFMRPQKS